LVHNELFAISNICKLLIQVISRFARDDRYIFNFSISNWYFWVKIEQNFLQFSDDKTQNENVKVRKINKIIQIIEKEFFLAFF